MIITSARSKLLRICRIDKTRRGTDQCRVSRIASRRKDFTGKFDVQSRIDANDVQKSPEQLDTSRVGIRTSMSNLNKPIRDIGCLTPKYDARSWRIPAPWSAIEVHKGPTGTTSNYPDWRLERNAMGICCERGGVRTIPLLGAVRVRVGGKRRCRCGDLSNAEFARRTACAPIDAAMSTTRVGLSTLVLMKFCTGTPCLVLLSFPCRYNTIFDRARPTMAPSLLH